MGRHARIPKVIAADDGIVLNWLVKLVVFFTIAGIILFDVTALVLVRGTVADTASDAATDSQFVYRNTGSEKQAEENAERFVEEEGAVFVDLTVDREENTLSVTAAKKAKTIFVHRFGPFEKYTVVTTTQTTQISS